jgi:hypothetical protein
MIIYFGKPVAYRYVSCGEFKTKEQNTDTPHPFIEMGICAGWYIHLIKLPYGNQQASCGIFAEMDNVSQDRRSTSK